ncbi:MAG: sensor histidine kinase, partial [Nocardioidaceae bacterium]
IHDTLAQGLSSIQLLLGAAEQQLADGQPARPLVDQARAVATTNLEEARRFVRALAPAALTDESLGGALDRLAATHRATLTVDGRPRPLPADQQEALLRITQEALANVASHAGAGNVAVTLGYLDDAVAIDVVDDGVGFDTSASQAGFGLRSMRARAERLRGTFTVESTPGGGTAIAVSLPSALP